MAKIICHHNGRYNVYHTVSDGFVFDASIDLERLRDFIFEETGQPGLDMLPSRLIRAHQKGHSLYSHESLEIFLCANRAGKNGTHLPYKECIKRFLS